MSLNEEKVISLLGNNGTVTLGQILDNLNVLEVQGYSMCVEYILTRKDKNIPWPAPYEAGTKIDGKPYYCCSYSTLDDEEWPEDTKRLNVYHVFVDD